MKQFFTALFVWTTIFSNVNAQSVGIGTNKPAASAQLDASSTTKGLLIPRLTAQRMTVAAPIKGLMVFDNETNSFWFFNGTAWTSLPGGYGSSGWVLTGMEGTADGTSLIGTLGDVPLNIRVNNEKTCRIDHLK